MYYFYTSLHPFWSKMTALKKHNFKRLINTHNLDKGQAGGIRNLITFI